jgi:superfamily I DNA and/or RNA helicase
MYVNYRNGDTFSSNDLMKLRSAIRDLRDATIKRTDVLVCTPFAASMTPVRENTSLDVIVVDEAARVTEPELWPLMAWYTPRVLLLVGDHHQLRPLVFSRKQQNPFVEQLQISLFTRLIWNGLPALMLLEQHRMNAALCSFISQVFYDGQLRTSNNLGQYVADVNRRFIKHNSQSNTFRLGGALLWVNVKDSGAEPDARKVSTINVHNAASTIAILQSMVSQNTIRLEEVTVLTPYRGQMLLYNSVISMYDTLQGLRVRRWIASTGESQAL